MQFVTEHDITISVLMSLALDITFGSVTAVGELITKTTVEVVTFERTVAAILGKSGNDLVKIQQLSWYKEA